MLRWIIPDISHTSQNRFSFYVWTMSLLTTTVLVVLTIYALFIADDWIIDRRLYVSGGALVLVFILSILAMGYADFAGIRAGIYTMKMALKIDDAIKLKAGQDGLVALMNVDNIDHEALHASARLHGWRLTIILVGVRLAVLLLAVFELREQLMPGMPVASSIQQTLEIAPFNL
ncbi:MAG TPA: hypothetical protein VHL11_14545, partial [Phototrophicaceae bacterium]|nr:hypothetical protein [Phototrophicaceae bacterium]